MSRLPLSSRTRDDLRKTVEVIARAFATSEVFIVGSQGILMAWRDAPAAFTMSPEINAYPGNARIWEAEQKTRYPSEDSEASEFINVHFGDGSDFHRVHGFYIDGVDEHTAKLPDGWQTRALIEVFNVDERIVRAVAPCAEDLIVSKPARLADKDKSFIEAYHAERPLDPTLIEARIEVTDLELEIAERARAYTQ